MCIYSTCTYLVGGLVVFLLVCYIIHVHVHCTCIILLLWVLLYLQGSRSVLGCTPASGRGPSSSPRKSAFSFKTARSSVGRGASGEWEGGGGGGGECVTLGREGGRLAEQQALASIGELHLCEGELKLHRSIAWL